MNDAWDKLSATGGAALRYWAGILALGFVLGTLRVLWIAPLVGETAAVLAELPAMLTASWLWARHLLERRPLPSRAAALGMGVLALAVLLASECALALALSGQSAAQWLTALGQAPGAFGLAGQAAFGLIPALAWRPATSPPGSP